MCPLLAGIAPTTSSCPAVARRSPRARAAHENTRREAAPPSERLRVTLVAARPPPSADRRACGATPLACRGTRAAVRRGHRRPSPPARGKSGSTYPSLPVVASRLPSPPCGDARSPGSTDRSSSRDGPRTESTRANVTRELPGSGVHLPRISNISIIAVRLHPAARAADAAVAAAAAVDSSSRITTWPSRSPVCAQLQAAGSSRSSRSSSQVSSVVSLKGSFLSFHERERNVLMCVRWSRAIG